MTGTPAVLYVLTQLILKPYFKIGLFVFFFFFFGLSVFSRATPMACGGSHARGLIRTIATGLHQSHSNTRSELCLQPTPQLMATQDP